MGIYSEVVFPWLLDKTEEVPMIEQRRLMLEGVSGRCIEIATGTGLNFPHFANRVSEIEVVEPRKALHSRASKRAVAAGIAVNFHRGVGEQLPFPNESFDYFISTCALCTVEDVEAVLREAFRVLKPRGQYVFFEHGLGNSPDLIKKQHRWNWLWQILACGCNLNRDLKTSLRDSPFDVELEDGPPVKGQEWIAYFHGKATKPA